MNAPREICWVITDGAAGNERQALALAERLEADTRVWRIAPRAPWSWLSPQLVVAARWSLPEPMRQQFAAPWPALAIGCGRSAALYTRMLRRWSANRTFTVQILDPRIAPSHYDMVVAPRHDRLSGDNVLSPLGSLNPVDTAWLAEAAEAAADLAALPAPRTAVLIGASRDELAIDEEYCRALLQALRRHHAALGGCFLVTTSRRTPAPLANFLRSQFAQMPGRFWGGQVDGANPYPGYLARAQAIVVTPDSVNMLSEACAVGVPVLTFVQKEPEGKLGLFHHALMEAGHLHRLGSAETPSCPTPLRETSAIADEVQRRWRAHMQCERHARN